jgi:hypothetical protein
LKSHNSGFAFPVTVTTSPTLLKGFDVEPRISLAVANVSTATVYVGFDSNLTTSNGFPIALDSQMSFTGHHGDLYAVVAADTSEVRVLHF